MYLGPDIHLEKIANSFSVGRRFLREMKSFE